MPEVPIMAVETKRVVGRRKLHFNSYDDILNDARMLSRVSTRPLGNWSLGQICEHLAKAMDMAIDGATFKPAWYIAIVGRMLKKRFLARPMSPGFQLPKNAGALLPPEISTAAGLAALEKAAARLQQNPTRLPHAIFGPMTKDEWDRLEWNHAAMHLSFVVPEA
jgi:hypothetical protein